MTFSLKVDVQDVDDVRLGSSCKSLSECGKQSVVCRVSQPTADVACHARTTVAAAAVVSFRLTMMF